MPQATDVQYLVLGDGSTPYMLARVRWPDIAQAISEDNPDWLDDPGLFDLPYEPAAEKVERSHAAEIAFEWGATLPLETSSGLIAPRLRRIPATWSDLVPVERRSWALHHVRVDHGPSAASQETLAAATTPSRRAKGTRKKAPKQ